MAAHALSLYAVPERRYQRDDVTVRRSLFGIRTGTSRSSGTHELAGHLPAQLVAQSASASSGWDLLLQGTVFQTTLAGAQLEAGVGERARADARIILEGIRSSTTQTRTRESNHVLWQSMVNQGSVSETLALPSFGGPTPPSFSAPGGLAVQVPAGELRRQVDTLAAQPGMAYLQALAARSDVHWQPVELVHRHWDYRQEGLTPAAAALLAAAVAWATGGLGAGLIGAQAGSAPALMANAAFNSLSAQAAIRLVNNRGDIGRTLSELASSAAVRATLAAALTAGVLERLNATGAMQALAQQDAASARLAHHLINAGGRALTNTAITGGDLEAALRRAIVGGLVDTAHGQAASLIKGLEADFVAHKLAHALAGCAAGAAVGSTCSDGAIGAAVGEIVAETFKGRVPAWDAPEAEWAAFDNRVRSVGQLVAGAVAALAGGDAQTAITTAGVAIDNNGRLLMRQRAMQQGVSPKQYWKNLHAQRLQNAVREAGGSVPGNLTAPGARVNYTRTDIQRLEAQLRSLNAHHPLIYSKPSATLSPLPASYVYMQYGVNMNQVVGARGTNAFGFPRDGNAAFRLMLKNHPYLFSRENQGLVKKGFAPKVDAQWVKYHPTHRAFMGSRLEHHHWMQGNIAVAIPAPVHVRWFNALHPYP
jgi:filamentous hemagglutinin